MYSCWQLLVLSAILVVPYTITPRGSLAGNTPTALTRQGRHTYPERILFRCERYILPDLQTHETTWRMHIKPC